MAYNAVARNKGKTSENTRTRRAGASGNVLINEKANRLNSYNVWDYAEGQDSYQISMLVDLTQPRDKVNDLSSFCYLSYTVAHSNELEVELGSTMTSNVGLLLSLPHAAKTYYYYYYIIITYFSKLIDVVIDRYAAVLAYAIHNYRIQQQKISFQNSTGSGAMCAFNGF